MLCREFWKPLMFLQENGITAIYKDEPSIHSGLAAVTSLCKDGKAWVSGLAQGRMGVVTAQHTLEGASEVSPGRSFLSRQGNYSLFRKLRPYSLAAAPCLFF